MSALSDLDKLPERISLLANSDIERIRIQNEYTRLSARSKMNVHLIVSTLSGKFEAPEYAPLHILQKSSGAKRDSMLAASAYLSTHTGLRRSLHYWLINSLMDTNKYAPFMEDLFTADPEAQRLVLLIAEAMELLDDEDSATDGHLDIFAVRNDVYGVSDESLTDAMLKDPENALFAAQLFVDRGSADALYEVLAAAPPLSEGAL